MKEEWNNNGGTMEPSGTVMVEQWNGDGTRVEQLRGNSGTLMEEQWNTEMTEMTEE